jgi:hypothetical protein
MNCKEIDDMLLQEIFSLREKLKIAVYHLKQLDKNFDEIEYLYTLNSIEFDQWMEEIQSEHKDYF